MNGFTERLRRRLLLAAAAAVCAFLLAGCAGRDVVFTSGLPEDEVFLIRNGDNSIVASLPETLIYVESIRSEISEALWSDDLYYEDETRAMALSRLSRVKVMNLMALEYGISLEPEEESAADSMATAWLYASREQSGGDSADFELLSRMYREYLLAEKVYRSVTAGVSAEISDDEARKVHLEVLAVSRIDGEGSRLSEAEDARAKARVQAARRRVMDGESFGSLVAEMSERPVSSLVIGRGEAEPAIEAAAFSLSSGEVSEVVTTSNEYLLLKCIINYDRLETELNREQIIRKRRDEVFSGQFDSFAEKLDIHRNAEVWGKITQESGAGSVNFFDFCENE